VTPLDIANLKVDLPAIDTDSMKISRNRELLRSYRTDPYLNEAVHVMDDMIAKPALQNGKLTRANNKSEP
jgi:carboxyl-terminal processing protease